MRTLAQETEAAFAFAKSRSGASGLLSIAGRTVSALIVSEPSTTGQRTAGAVMSTRTAEVGVLQSELGQAPEPGDKASLDGWACEIADEGVTYVPGGYILQLQTATG